MRGINSSVYFEIIETWRINFQHALKGLEISLCKNVNSVESSMENHYIMFYISKFVKNFHHNELQIKIKLNSWHYSSEEPRPTEAVATIWQYRGPCG